jgi:hypothetical protein
MISNQHEVGSAYACAYREVYYRLLALLRSRSCASRPRPRSLTIPIPLYQQLIILRVYECLYACMYMYVCHISCRYVGRMMNESDRLPRN